MWIHGIHRGHGGALLSEREPCACINLIITPYIQNQNKNKNKIQKDDYTYQ